MSESIVALLDTQWRAMADLAAEFSADDWDTPTELPGWSVKDCYSHVVGTERTIRGEPPPEVDLSGLDHMTAPSSAMTEPPVAARRATPPADVLAEFVEVTRERVAELEALTPDQWEEVGFTPTGPGPYSDFMRVRVFDCWMHEQDVRRALGRPGHQEGPVAEFSMGRCEQALGFIVGKKAGAPDGTSVVFDLTGTMARTLPVVVDGRAAVASETPSDPTVTLTMGQEAFWALGGGRWSPDRALADGVVTIEGDTALGEAVVRSMNFMI